MANQFNRKVGLIVSTGTKGLDLSQMRIVFSVNAPDADAPPTAFIRVYNLSPSDAKAIQKEFQKVTLQAGYMTGNYGVIFSGTIAQIRRGRESATDDFVDIMAADSDAFFNFAVVNTTLAKNSDAQQQYNAVLSAAGKYGVTSATASAANLNATGGTLPRGKTLFGLGRTALNNLAASKLCSWSIQNGKVVVLPLKGYAAGEVIVLNSRTGLVGVPEATQNGVDAMCLLNPFLQVGGRVKIDQAILTNTTVKQQGIYPQYGNQTYPADTSTDGTYRILVVEHKGDTRGEAWYTKLTCLAIDNSSGTVLPNG
jgi:hypothetical protein